MGNIGMGLGTPEGFDWANFRLGLRACRVQAGYSQKDVAKYLGVTLKSVISWETGKATPAVVRGQKLAMLYGIPMEHMDFTREGNTARTPAIDRAVDISRKMEPDTLTEPDWGKGSVDAGTGLYGMEL